MAEEAEVTKAVRAYATLPLGREIFEQYNFLLTAVNAILNLSDLEGPAIAITDTMNLEGKKYLQAAGELAKKYGLPPERGMQMAAVFLHPKFAIALGVDTFETRAYLAEMKASELQQRLASSQEYRLLLDKEARIAEEKSDLVKKLSEGL